MNQMDQAALREALRRVAEVRGLSRDAEHAVGVEPGGTAELAETLQDLASELERSHRRLIETNVQLVSLREVASSVGATLDLDDATRVVTRYLCRAFGFDDGFLLLANRESMTL